MFNCPHGLNLYGTHCLLCDREGITAVDAGTKERARVATWRAEVQRRTEEAIDLNDQRVRRMAEEMNKRTEQAWKDAAFGIDMGRPGGDRTAYAQARRTPEGWRWEHVNDPRTRKSHWQGTATPNPVEIITDPLDQRGVNARRVGPGL